MTPLKGNRTIKKKLGLSHLFIKDESVNRFGTWKDRRSEFIVKKALDNHVKKLCLITSGNAGFSIVQYAKPYGIKTVCVVDKKMKPNIKQLLRKLAYKVIEVDLSKRIFQPEQIIALARENEREVIWDVTNGYEDAYEGLIREIKPLNPDVIICPVGSGEAYVGFYDAIKKYKLKAKLIGISPRKNPSLADKLSTRWTPYESKIKAIRKSGHRIIKLSESEIKRSYKDYHRYLQCEPSSCIVFSALEKLSLPKTEKVVVINSGKGLI